MTNKARTKLCKKCGEVITEKANDSNTQWEARNYCSVRCKAIHAKRTLKPLDKKTNGLEVMRDFGMSNDKKPKRKALFKCFCGTFFKATVNSVKTGHTKSCGCLAKIGNSKTHGLSKHKLYSAWGGIIDRIENHKNNRYNRYGGRGIKICKQWRNDFLSFYHWATSNGWEPGLTIDRIDVDGDYNPENCQWISMEENRVKDKIKFTPSDMDKSAICNIYKNTNLTLTYIAGIYSTHKENIRNILKDNNIIISNKRRMASIPKN